MNYYGTFEHTIDSKKRLTLPSKFCIKLSKIIIVNKGIDNCLELRTEEAWNNYMNKLSQYSQMKKDVRILNRFTSANASDVEIDSAKRILLPTFLLEQVNITKDVMVIGVGDHIEIWDKKNYSQFTNKYYDQYEVIAEKIDE